jgi:hypothetical protein
VLKLAGYSISHTSECYVLSKNGDGQGKSNTYHATLDNAVVSLFEKVLPERIAQRSDYRASMAELLEVVREVREELINALSLAGTAGNGSGSANSDKRYPYTPEPNGVGA